MDSVDFNPNSGVFEELDRRLKSTAQWTLEERYWRKKVDEEGVPLKQALEKRLRRSAVGCVIREWNPGYASLQDSLAKLELEYREGRSNDWCDDEFELIKLGLMEERSGTLPMNKLFQLVTVLRLCTGQISKMDKTLMKMTNLDSLILSGNLLSEVQGNLIPKSVRFLELFGNFLQDIESMVSFTPFVIYLGLGRNMLTEPSLTCLIALEYLVFLDLSDNELVDLIWTLEAIKNIPSLKGLSLIGNPCSVVISYRKSVREALPGLIILDGVQTGIRPPDKNDVPPSKKKKSRGASRKKKTKSRRNKTESRKKKKAPTSQEDEDFNLSGELQIHFFRVIGIKKPQKKKSKKVQESYHLEIECPFLDEKYKEIQLRSINLEKFIESNRSSERNQGMNEQVIENEGEDLFENKQRKLKEPFCLDLKKAKGNLHLRLSAAAVKNKRRQLNISVPCKVSSIPQIDVQTEIIAKGSECKIGKGFHCSLQKNTNLPLTREFSLKRTLCRQMVNRPYSPCLLWKAFQGMQRPQLKGAGDASEVKKLDCFWAGKAAQRASVFSVLAKGVDPICSNSYGMRDQIISFLRGQGFKELTIKSETKSIMSQSNSSISSNVNDDENGDETLNDENLSDPCKNKSVRENGKIDPTKSGEINERSISINEERGVFNRSCVEEKLRICVEEKNESKRIIKKLKIDTGSYEECNINDKVSEELEDLTTTAAEVLFKEDDDKTDQQMKLKTAEGDKKAKKRSKSKGKKAKTKAKTKKAKKGNPRSKKAKKSQGKSEKGKSKKKGSKSKTKELKSPLDEIKETAISEGPEPICPFWEGRKRAPVLAEDVEVPGATKFTSDTSDWKKVIQFKKPIRIPTRNLRGLRDIFRTVLNVFLVYQKKKTAQKAHKKKERRHKIGKEVVTEKEPIVNRKVLAVIPVPLEAIKWNQDYLGYIWDDTDPCIAWKFPKIKDVKLQEEKGGRKLKKNKSKTRDNKKENTRLTDIEKAEKRRDEINEAIQSKKMPFPKTLTVHLGVGLKREK